MIQRARNNKDEIIRRIENAADKFGKMEEMLVSILSYASREVSVIMIKKIASIIHNNKIILSEICFEKGVNQIINTIIEEFIHLKYDVKDETRAFQDAIITEMITYMKNVHAYIL